MLVTMKNSDLVDRLMQLADGNFDLVREAMRSCADSNGAADLKKIVEYIVEHKARAPAAA